jgi:hypothetical protein
VAVSSGLSGSAAEGEQAGLPCATCGYRGSSLSEPGLDLHEWQTRWQELEDAFAEEPAETLPEMVRFVQQLLGERGYELAEPVTVEGEDPDIVRQFLAARELARPVEAGKGNDEDVQAFESLSEIYLHIVETARRRKSPPSGLEPGERQIAAIVAGRVGLSAEAAEARTLFDLSHLA